MIQRCYDLAEEQKAAIPVVDVVETLRHLTDDGSETVSRNDYKLVQTPQVFETELLKRLMRRSLPRSLRMMPQWWRQWAYLYIWQKVIVKI